MRDARRIPFLLVAEQDKAGDNVQLKLSPYYSTGSTGVCKRIETNLLSLNLLIFFWSQ